MIPFPRRSRWPRALAALLALAVVGLGAWAGILSSRLGDQAGEIARLRLALAAAEERGRELASARSDLAAVRDQFALVTSPAVEVCPLRATGEVPGAGAARGVLFVQADHQHWYLRVHGLKPEPADKDYQLWFLVGGMPVSGGTFSVAAGQPVDLASPTMPVGTKAVAITLERRGGNYRPTSPMILYGEGLTRL